MLEKFINDLVSVVNFLSPRRIQRIKKILNNKTDYVAVVLDDINQPHNATAVLRSFEAFGFLNVYVVEKRSIFKPVKGISNSAEKWIFIKRFKDYDECYQELKKNGYKLCITTPYDENKKTITPENFSFDSKLAVVIGNEVEGVSEYFKERADIFMSIKTYGFVESLNLSVACGIIMYELRKKLENEKIDFRLNQLKKAEIFSKWIYKSISFTKLKGGE